MLSRAAYGFVKSFVTLLVSALTYQCVLSSSLENLIYSLSANGALFHKHLSTMFAHLYLHDFSPLLWGLGFGISKLYHESGENSVYCTQICRYIHSFRVFKSAIIITKEEIRKEKGTENPNFKTKETA